MPPPWTFVPSVQNLGDAGMQMQGGCGCHVLEPWVILQVADLAFESFGLPATAMRFVWYALVAVSPLWMERGS